MGEKNIAFLINTLCAGGAERVISRISGLLEESYNVYILLLDSGGIAYECSGDIIDIGGTSKNYYVRAMHAWFSVNKLVKEKKIEHIISFLDVPNIINVLKVKNCQRIISIRCYFNKQLYRGIFGKIKLYLCRRSYKNADKVIAVSKALAEYSIAYFNLDRKKVNAIENPYNIDDINLKAKETIEESVERFILSHETSITMGRLESQKGYELLIQCFARVCENESKAGLIILGEGSLHNELVNKAAKLGISDNILFLGNKKNPFAYISKSQLYVSASLFEGFPNALVEAMACGIPVMHTDCLTGPREILTSNYAEKMIDEPEFAEYGILMPDFNRIDKIGKSKEDIIEIYADTWIKMLQDKNAQIRYGKLAQDRVRLYSVNECVRKYRNIIESV